MLLSARFIREAVVRVVGMFDRIFNLVFLLSLLLIAFVLGSVVMIFKLPPYKDLEGTARSVYNMIYPPEVQIAHFYPQRYTDFGTKTHQPDKLDPGVTLITGFWVEGNIFIVRWKRNLGFRA